MNLISLFVGMAANQTSLPHYKLERIFSRLLAARTEMYKAQNEVAADPNDLTKGHLYGVAIGIHTGLFDALLALGAHENTIKQAVDAMDELS